MAIKGSATIELTNTDGTKQIIKHDNMITNAVADMFRSYMGDMPLIHKLNFYDYTYASTIFGGLLLFDDRLNDDASDYAIPSTKITGYASDTAYAGDDLSRGSRNIAESGLQEDGSYKFVWDFGTSQGNGTIRSIALCPIAMGKIGASDAPVRSEYVSYGLGEEAYIKRSEAKGAFADYYKLIDQNATVDGVNADCLNPVAIIGEYIYAVDRRNIDCSYSESERAYNLVNNGGILKLYKFKYQFNSVSISATTGRAKYIETIEVQIPTEIVNLAYTPTGSYYGVVGIHFNKRDNKLIVFPYSLKTALAPNATLPYVEIDLLDNYKVTNCSMTNTTNQSLGIYGHGFSWYGARYGLYISNDHILMIGGTGADARMYVINRADNAKVVKVKIGGEDFVPYNLNYKNALNFCPKMINNNTAVVTFGVLDGGADPYDMYIIDLTTGVAKKCNTVVSNYDYGNVINIKRPIMTDGAIVYDSDDYVGCTPKLNPFILTTKNNLDEPVVKTASQTMKITYTLTESAGV